MPETHERDTTPTQELGVPEAGFIRKNLVWIGGGLVVAAAAGAVWGYNTLTSSDGEPVKSPEPIEQSPALPGQSFETVLKQTQEKDRAMPEVLANFQLSKLLSGNFPSGTNTAELISVRAESCVTASGATIPAHSISRIVFRNQGGDTGSYKTALLTNDHVEKAESYRTDFRETEVKNGYVTPKAKDFSGKAKNQIFGQLADNICGTGGARLVDPEISSQQILISNQEIGPEFINFGEIKPLLITLGGVLLLALAAIGGTWWFKGRSQPK